MIRVVIGTEPNQYVAQKVLEYSIKTNTKEPVEIKAVVQEGERVGGTNFGFVRFNVPKICGYKGRAIYLDADQLVFTDIKELHDQLDDEHAVALVNEPEGWFGGKEVAKHNQTSVMVLNCDKLKSWEPPVMFKNVVPNRAQLGQGQIHYRDFMTLSWMDPKQIKPIDPTWNHFNIINEKTRLVHFSHVRSQPWKNPKHELSIQWGQWLRKTVRAGALSRIRLVREVIKGHVHPYFLRYAI